MPRRMDGHLDGHRCFTHAGPCAKHHHLPAAQPAGEGVKGRYARVYPARLACAQAVEEGHQRLLHRGRAALVGAVAQGLGRVGFDGAHVGAGDGDVAQQPGGHVRQSAPLAALP